MGRMGDPVPPMGCLQSCQLPPLPQLMGWGMQRALWGGRSEHSGEDAVCALGRHSVHTGRTQCALGGRSVRTGRMQRAHWEDAVCTGRMQCAHWEDAVCAAGGCNVCGGRMQHEHWEDAVCTLRSFPSSQRMACARLALATLLGLLCSATVPGEQRLLEAALSSSSSSSSSVCRAGSSSLLPTFERRKKEENLAWIRPD